jgi:hypothetical protein
VNVELVTQAEYARRRGVAKSAVAKAVAERRISLINGKVDPAVADIQWERNTRARADSGRATTAGSAGQLALAPALADAAPTPPSIATPSSMDGAAYSEARARRERAEAEEAEMRTAKIRGTMVLREDVDRGTFEVLREARDRLTAAGRRLASEVASISSAESCEAVIDREHRIVLELMVTSFREKLGTAPRAAE